jgi:hypothetical protein
VVVVVVTGRAIVVVDCSEVVVRLYGAGAGDPQPASIVRPAISAAPIDRLKREVVQVIV